MTIIRNIILLSYSYTKFNIEINTKQLSIFGIFDHLPNILRLDKPVENDYL